MNAVSQALIEQINFRAEKNSTHQPAHFIFKDVLMPHHKIVLADNARAIIIEDYALNTDAVNTHAITDIEVGQNAQLTYLKIQEMNLQSTHTANINIHQAANSHVNFLTLSLGAKLQRDEVTIFLAANNASCQLNGLYLLNHDAQEIQHHLKVNHAALHGKSDMLFKGILNKKSKAQFRGKVYVHPHAQKTQTAQANHNLLLDAAAEVSTQPELEIFADDIKCTHGATVGQLDETALFYLQSRGVPLTTAKQMLIIGFAAEVFANFPSEALRSMIQERINHYVKS